MVHICTGYDADSKEAYFSSNFGGSGSATATCTYDLDNHTITITSFIANGVEMIDYIGMVESSIFAVFPTSILNQ